VFVIDCIELIAFDQAKKMGEFERGDSIRLKKDSKAFDEVINVWYVGENVVGAYQVGVIPGCPERRGLGGIKKRNFSRDASALRDSSHIACRFDTEHGDSSFNEIAQQIAIITANFYDPTPLIYAKATSHQSTIMPRMFEPTIGKRGKIEIVSKNSVGRFERVELNKKTLVADVSV
jgi:hypothetical protein